MYAHLQTAMLTVVSALGMLAPPVFGQSVEESTKPSKSFLEIRLARNAEAPGFARAAVPQSGDVIFVSDEALVKTEDFEHVEARPTPNGLVLRAQWRNDAAVRMAAVHRGEIGTGNEFLAVFIDGELVNVVRLRADPHAAVTSKVDIAVPVSAEKVESIVAAVRSHWRGGGG